MFSWIFALIATATVSFNAVRVSERITLSDAFLVVTFFLLMLSAVLRGRIRRPPDWFVLGAMAMSVSSIGSALASDDFLENISFAIRFIVAYVGLPLVILGVSGGNIDRQRKIVLVWIGFVAVNGFIAALDASGISNLAGILSDRVYRLRYAGLTAHPNHLALACAMVLPVLLALYIPNGKKLSRALFLLVLSGVLLGVLVSGSRAGLIGLIWAVVYWGCINHAWRRFFIKLALVGVIGAVIIFGALELRQASTQVNQGSGIVSVAAFVFSRLGGGEGVQESDAGRLDKYALGINEFIEDPILGVGYSKIRAAHNIYLQLLQGGGLFGFLAFSVLITGALCALRFEVLRGHSIERRLMCAGLIGSLGSWLIMGLAQNLIFDRFLLMPLGVALSIVWRNQLRESDSDHLLPSSSA